MRLVKKDFKECFEQYVNVLFNYCDESHQNQFINPNKTIEHIGNQKSWFDLIKQKNSSLLDKKTILIKSKIEVSADNSEEMNDESNDHTKKQIFDCNSVYPLFHKTRMKIIKLDPHEFKNFKHKTQEMIREHELSMLNYAKNICEEFVGHLDKIIHNETVLKSPKDDLFEKYFIVDKCTSEHGISIILYDSKLVERFRFFVSVSENWGENQHYKQYYQNHGKFLFTSCLFKEKEGFGEWIGYPNQSFLFLKKTSMGLDCFGECDKYIFHMNKFLLKEKVYADVYNCLLSEKENEINFIPKEKMKYVPELFDLYCVKDIQKEEQKINLVPMIKSIIDKRHPSHDQRESYPISNDLLNYDHTEFKKFMKKPIRIEEYLTSKGSHYFKSHHF